MKEGTFLGYKVNPDGLKVCPGKVDAVLSLPTPKCLKDVQKLNGKLASLNIFLSKSAEKSLPFFKTLKKCTKKSNFQWTTKAETAFKQMKKSIVKLPMLTTPKEKEELILYLACAKEAVSAVLMTERDRKQMVVYFVSHALQGPEINYTPMEKLILALVSASKQLKRYFQAHTIVVITDQPIRQILSNPEVTERLLKWRFELEEHDIHYRPRTSVKGQILADFIMERPQNDPQDVTIEDEEVLPDLWMLFTNGSSCIDGSRAGLIIINPKRVEFTYALRFRFDATNNESEYEALIAGLRISERMGVKNLQAKVDSRLVANQVNETYIAKGPGMVKYLEKVKNLVSAFKQFTITQIPKRENKKADTLRKIASTNFAHLSKQVLVKEVKEKSIDEKEKESHQKKRKKARVIHGKAGRPLQANYVLREIHEGSCSMHSGPRSVVAKALRSGYYWLTMHINAKKLIRECKDCQVHRPVPRNPQQNLTLITSPWPFYKWGIDIAEPFSEGLVILVEISMPTTRTAEVDVIKNNEALRVSLDLLEERREHAAIQKSKAKMEKYYNARVRNTSFRPGDLVYRNNEASYAEERGKLEPKWEGPYEVTEALGKGAYKLRDRNGNNLPRT
nr:reverse transcriptase domain-containing protein [Tanacetum cinerariifolium]